MARILITGGAGYIGSHVAKMAAAAGHDITILDDLSRGRRAAARYGSLVTGRTHDRALVERTIRERGIEAVMHFAAFTYVGESVEKPALYRENNYEGTRALLGAMTAAGVRRIIFSSTAAVYGNPRYTPIDEAHPQAPVNPYGTTKVDCERMMEELSRTAGLRYAFLRYFNACGCDPEGELGEDHRPETHLIPRLLLAALGRLESRFTIFGIDYPTQDGTAVRDYVHVNDLASAHLRALDYLGSGGAPGAFNLGNGGGFTVREVIETAARVCGRKIDYQEGPRRPGDPPVLVAASGKARETLGWEPRYPGLEEIVRTAWEWHRKHPQGYESD
jgi:UDP-glucose-4-epimerase GalE